MSTISFFSPSEIERETGFGKEQLRKWRQRYGFPPRESTLDGQSTYSRKTVDQLHLIKRLLEAGFRPYQVVGKTVVELEKLKFQLGLNVEGVITDELSNKLIENIKLGDLKKFVALLKRIRSIKGIEIFHFRRPMPLVGI
jgi:hypothetical protein